MVSILAQSGRSGALLLLSPLRTVQATLHRTRLKQIMKLPIRQLLVYSMNQLFNGSVSVDGKVNAPIGDWHNYFCLVDDEG